MSILGQYPVSTGSTPLSIFFINFFFLRFSRKQLLRFPLILVHSIPRFKIYLEYFSTPLRKYANNSSAITLHVQSIIVQFFFFAKIAIIKQITRPEVALHFNWFFGLRIVHKISSCSHHPQEYAQEVVPLPGFKTLENPS